LKRTKERNKKRKSSKTKGDEQQLGREEHESHQEHLRKGRGQNELQRIAVECKKATLCVLYVRLRRAQNARRKEKAGKHQGKDMYSWSSWISTAGWSALKDTSMK
jgi:hypothetical protein